MEESEEKQDPGEATLEFVAKQVEHFSQSVASYVREHEPKEVLQRALNAARKNPDLLIGGFFLAGVGLVRLARLVRSRAEIRPAGQEAHPPKSEEERLEEALAKGA